MKKAMLRKVGIQMVTSHMSSSPTPALEAEDWGTLCVMVGLGVAEWVVLKPWAGDDGPAGMMAVTPSAVLVL